MITVLVVFGVALYAIYLLAFTDPIGDLRSWWHRTRCAQCARAHDSLTDKNLVKRWP